VLNPLDIGQKILAAQPFSLLLGTEMSSYGPEGVELRLVLHDNIKQQHGFAHGGVLAYLADNALTFAGGFVMGGGVLTAEIKLNYTRPAVGEMLVARAWVVSSGKTQAVARCDVFCVKDGEEKLCVAAQGMVLRADAAGPARVPAANG
jgi:uncharacterized protein (TIGR00369 family)